MVFKGAGRIKVKDKLRFCAGRRQEESKTSRVKPQEQISDAGYRKAADQTALIQFIACLKMITGSGGPAIRSEKRSHEKQSGF